MNANCRCHEAAKIDFTHVTEEDREMSGILDAVPVDVRQIERPDSVTELYVRIFLLISLICRFRCESANSNHIESICLRSSLPDWKFRLVGHLWANKQSLLEIQVLWLVIIKLHWVLILLQALHNCGIRQVTCLVLIRTGKRPAKML